jgi:hypothetical protein
MLPTLTYRANRKVRPERSAGKAVHASGHGRSDNSKHGELHGVCDNSEATKLLVVRVSSVKDSRDGKN